MLFPMGLGLPPIGLYHILRLTGRAPYPTTHKRGWWGDNLEEQREKFLGF